MLKKLKTLDLPPYGKKIGLFILYVVQPEMAFIARVLKQIAIPPLTLLLCCVALTRLQAWQYVAAYSGSGFAKTLPNLASLPKTPNCNVPPVQVLSYNVMYGSAFIESMVARFPGSHFTGNYLPWSERLPEIRTRILGLAPDLIGLQEMGTDADINAIVPTQEYSLVTYHLGEFHYGDSALLYKTARFEALDSGQIWLGFTPELPMSLGFTPLAMFRYINWTILLEKTTGFTFMFVNTHFDNNLGNKEPSATLFHDRIANLAKDLPIIVTGDFNTPADTERYHRFTGASESPVLLKNTYVLAHEPLVNAKLHPIKRIDHILAGGTCKIETDNWLVDTRPLQNGQPLSDHDPISVRLNFS
jgi:endonuclease/exonuclease/phosphatase family metal-dependent hydrolase